MIGFNPYAGRQARQSALISPQQPQLTNYGGIGMSMQQPSFPTMAGSSHNLPTSSFLANLRSAPQRPSDGFNFSQPAVTARPQDQPVIPQQAQMPSQWPGLNPWAQEFGAGNTMATIMGGPGGGNPYAGFFNGLAANTTPMYDTNAPLMNQSASYQGLANHLAAAKQQAIKEASGDPRQNSGQSGGLPSPGQTGLLALGGGLAMGNPYTLPLAGAAYGGKALWDWITGGGGGSSSRPAGSPPASGGGSTNKPPTHRN